MLYIIQVIPGATVVVVATAGAAGASVVGATEMREVIQYSEHNLK
jgi:hypothetical protein